MIRDIIREMVGTTLDIAAHQHSASWEDMDIDEYLLIGIGLVILLVAIVVYMKYF